MSSNPTFAHFFFETIKVNHPLAINSAVFVDLNFGDIIVVSIVDKGLQKYASNGYAINYAIDRVREGHNNNPLLYSLSKQYVLYSSVDLGRPP